MKKYIKNAIKYILYDYKPRKVYIKPEMKSPSELFKGKTVLITGGSTGIGYEIAKRFAEESANVIITGRNEEKLSNAVKSMPNAIYFVNDVKDISTHESLLKFIEDKYGDIDILINNAGISNHESDFLNVTEKDFDDQFGINLKGAYFLTQSCIKKVIDKKKKFDIIFITSERGSQCDILPYGLTKVAMNSLVEGLSCKYYKHGIRVNAIAPGVTASKLTKIDKNGDLATDHNISKRYFAPEEIAETVLFIASDYSLCISGEVIHCNGGNHLNKYW